MSKAIGTRGLATVSADTDKVRRLSFPLTTATTKKLGLTRGNYSLYFSLAGATDVSYQVTRDSLEAITNGNAKWTTAVALSNQATGDYYIGDAMQISGVQVTCTKNGSATDDATKTTLLGARAQFRAVPIMNPNLNNLAAGTDYTGTFTQNPNYKAT